MFFLKKDSIRINFKESYVRWYLKKMEACTSFLCLTVFTSLIVVRCCTVPVSHRWGLHLAQPYSIWGLTIWRWMMVVCCFTLQLKHFDNSKYLVGFCYRWTPSLFHSLSLHFRTMAVHILIMNKYELNMIAHLIPMCPKIRNFLLRSARMNNNAMVWWFLNQKQKHQS